MKLAIFLFVLGVLVVLGGKSSLETTAKSEGGPVKIDLATLDPDAIFDTPYVTLGSHYAMYDMMISEFKMKPDQKEPTADTPISISVYPIGVTHIEKGMVPVVVRTHEYKKAGNLPEYGREEKSLTGMIHYDYGSLGFKIRKAFKDNLPNLDFSKAVIFEKNDKPLNSARAWFWIIIGVCMVLGGVYRLYNLRQKRKQEYAEAQADD